MKIVQRYTGLLLFALVFFSCSLGAPEGGTGGSVAVRYTDAEALDNAILNARNNVKIALFRYETSTVMALNELQAKGVSVSVIVDSDNWETVTGLNPLIGIRYGNASGGMRSNFVIIDDIKTIVLSSADLGEEAVICAFIRSEHFVTALSTEFRQMFDNNYFGGTSQPKKELNEQRTFFIDNNTVQLYMLPQNDIYQPALSRIAQCSGRLLTHMPYLENSRFSSELTLLKSYSTGIRVWLGSNAPAMMSNCTGVQLWSETTRSSNTVAGTTFHCDRGTSGETMVMTTFPLDSEAGLELSDGLVLLITGPAAREIGTAAESRYTKPTETTITIGSFNIENFGTVKWNKPEVRAILAQIATNFDILAVQEFSDSSFTVQSNFLALLNSSQSNWTIINSIDSSGEQYAFYYRFDRVSQLSAASYPDGTSHYSRPPFFAHFQTVDGSVDFVVGNIHTTPGELDDIEEITNAMTWAQGNFTEQDIIMVGDFNADGTYYDASSYQSIFPASTYNWLIPNGSDTTVASGINAYDRIVTTLSCSEFLTGEWGILRFDDEISFRGLSVDPDEVSDHYPVWFRIRAGQDTD